MDDRQFDTISRSLASRSSRRQALRSGGAGAAILGLLGLRAARSAAAQDDDIGNAGETGLGDDGTCRLQFEGTVRLGPSAAPGQTSRITGLLSFRVGSDGAIDQGTLETDDGAQYPVVGQGSGRSVALRIQVGDDVLVAVGAGENALSDCNGEYGGPSSGPVRGDLGDWVALAGESSSTTPSGGPAPTAASGGNNGGSSGGSSGGNSGGSGTTPAPTEAPDCSGAVCDTTTFMIDPVTCECVCYDNGVACGNVCCPSGFVCNDESTGSCSCPPGSEQCNATCVTCAPGQILDMGSCACVDDPCPQGGELCGANCVDTVNDRNNCGACGNVCATGVPCIAGNCICPPGYSVCASGCEDLTSDASNCGACGNVCTTGTSCQNGNCV
jgi:hypothetical protein